MIFKKQSGVVLVISLVILFALTLLVVSVSQSGVVQEKMTSAVRDAHISLEIAESGLKDAEEEVDGFDDLSEFDALNYFYSQGTGPSDLFDASVWTVAKTNAATTETTDKSDQVAQYFIEHIGMSTTSSAGYDSVTVTGYGKTTIENHEAHIFKLVSRALGNSGNSERILVSYYSKGF